MNTVYLMLGGNLGDTASFFKQAIALITTRIGEVITLSAIYETEPWGVDGQQNYFNQAVELKTLLMPEKLLKETQAIEYELGRRKSLQNWAPRIIDIDILFYNQEIIEQIDLKIPHPLLHQRMFCLIPMQEIAPDYIHPIMKYSIRSLVNICNDKLLVRNIK